MASSPYDSLLAKLKAAPGNHVLRVAIIRKMRADGAASQALALALDVDPEAIANAEDRALVIEVMAEAGLDDGEALVTKGSALQSDGKEDPGSDQSNSESADQNSGAHVIRLADKATLSGGSDGDGHETEDEPPFDFSDVAGLQSVKDDIHRRIITPFQRRGLVARFRKRSGGGVLMYGPPGCGKTMLAKATAGACNLPFQSVNLTDVLDPYVGVSERRLSGIFNTARSRAPVVLFFDEVDSLSVSRGGNTPAHYSQIVSHFLNEMDGAGKSNEGLLILAATNIPWSMDAAFLRPGRFDRMFFVPPPDFTARISMFELELQGRPVERNIGLKELAKMTSGFSGADIKGAVEDATDAAIDASIDKGVDVPISEKMLQTALQRRRSSVTDWLTTARNYATYSNESGRYDEILSFLQKHGA